MSETPVISVRGLSKKYRIGLKARAHDTMRDAIVDYFGSRFKRMSGSALRDDAEDTIWALRDVSFDVNQGEVVGVIGRNGAGKSTLLKILTRITEPSAGKIGLRGRVASLLEVGTGFNPELTGRENIYLNGAILGMTKGEITSKLDEIIDFSGIEKFIDTPVKRYSSGMYVRLAFAVAAHLEPEILLVDEVLAVGDAEFQKRCLGKMDDVARSGRTILFVSHNMNAISSLCSRAVMLKNGTIKCDDYANIVINDYISEILSKKGGTEVDLRTCDNRYGHKGAKIIFARILGENNVSSVKFLRTTPMKIEYEVDVESRQNLHFSIAIVSNLGINALHIDQDDSPELKNRITSPGRYKVTATIKSLPLAAGNYNLTLAVHTNNMMPIDVIKEVLPFSVEDIPDSPRPYIFKSEHGLCWTENDWKIERIPN